MALHRNSVAIWGAMLAFRESSGNGVVWGDLGSRGLRKLAIRTKSEPHLSLVRVTSERKRQKIRELFQITPPLKKEV